MFIAAIVGWLRPIAVLAIVPFFGSMIVAIITYRTVERSADLKYRRAYYALVAPLLISAAVATVACGGTMFISRNGPMGVVGFTALGMTNVIVTILAWRALVAPSARRAALAGMVAVCAECVAMTIDISINLHVRGFGDQPETGIALLAALGSIATGSLACFASLITFGPDLPDVPEARVVDGD